MKTVLAEVITIGDEILYGQILDTNTQFISDSLSFIGIKTIRKSSVGDNEQEILNLLGEAQTRADVILITGGLGPTKDDITKKTLCKFFNVNLITHEATLHQLESFFSKHGKQLTGMNKMQAEVPENCKVLLNSQGTAPGMWFQQNGKVFISMPGVPYEMKKIMTEEVNGKLKHYFKPPVILHRMVHTIGIGESFLAEMIEKWEDALPEEMKLAYLPSVGVLRLRITAIGDDYEKLKAETDSQIEQLSQLIKPFIYGYEKDDKLEAIIGRILIGQNKTISTAESCTGGYLAHMITSISGSASYYIGSIISYSNESKVAQLGVDEEIIKTKTPVCEEVVKQMAEGVRNKFNTTIGISTSGIAGPDGGTKENPVGTVWIGYADGEKTIAKKFMFGHTRENNIRLSAIHALNLLRVNL